jgi:delta 1-pyrroline-5-carboxylate dehydrogenase
MDRSHPKGGPVAVSVRTLQNFVGGDWVDSTSETAREIVSPVTGETLAEAPDASPDDVDRAVAAARDSQPRWAALSAWERARICDYFCVMTETPSQSGGGGLSISSAHWSR